MSARMNLAVKKDEGSVPGGGFHYMLHPFEIEPVEVPLWDCMGYVLFSVERELGERMLREAGAALRHQLEVAQRCERAMFDAEKAKAAT